MKRLSDAAPGNEMLPAKRLGALLVACSMFSMLTGQLRAEFLTPEVVGVAGEIGITWPAIENVLHPSGNVYPELVFHSQDDSFGVVSKYKGEVSGGTDLGGAQAGVSITPIMGRLYAKALPPADPNVVPPGPGGKLGQLARMIVMICSGGFAFPNGLDVDPASKSLYLIESQSKKILRLPLPANDDAPLGAPELFYDLGGSGGDGCVFDAEGNFWVADFHRPDTKKGRITVLSPAGKVLGQLDVPAQVVSNITFGGTNHDEIFCTTGTPDGVGLGRAGVGDVGEGAGLVLDGLQEALQRGCRLAGEPAWDPETRTLEFVWVASRAMLEEDRSDWRGASA